MERLGWGQALLSACGRRVKLLFDGDCSTWAREAKALGRIPGVLNLHLLVPSREIRHNFVQTGAGAMKAKPLIFTAGVGAILVIVWMLLWRPTVLAPDTSSKAARTVDEILPLPTASVPLTAPALLPPPIEPWYDTAAPATTNAQGGALLPEEQKPYAPAPPPNPHAVPAWPERLPHRESQIPRTLLVDPKP
jgi:hypothetical protein